MDVSVCLNTEESKELIALCRAGKLYEIERWIANGKSIATAPAIKKTPILVAVETGFHSLVKLLARNEPRQEQKDRALRQAVANRRLDMVAVLIEQGANIRSVPLEDALMTWDREIMQFFLDQGADALTGNPFAIAFREKIQRALRPFVDYKRAHPELADQLQSQADRALRHFASEGNLKWVCLMMWAGADPRSCGPMFDDRFENDPECYTTALDEACAKGSLDILKKLKPDPKRDDFAKLLHSAASSDSMDVIDYLLICGGSPNDKPDGGSSALDHCLWALHWQDRNTLFSKQLASKYALRGGLDRIERLLQAGAQWRPDAYQMKSLRKMLCECEPAVTVSLMKLFAKYKAAPVELLETLLDTPRMRSQSCLDLRVSKAALKRTLHFAAGLVTALEEQGFKVTASDGCREKTLATIYGQSIGFAIIEKVNRVDLTSPPKGGVLDRVLTYGGRPYRFELSGHLSLQIWTPYQAYPKSWSDRKTRTLEDQLSDIVAAFMRIALAEKADEQKRAAEKAEAERRAAERARQAALISKEEARVRALHRAATSLERAERIRHLIAAASKAAQADGHAVEAGTPFGDWLVWAGRQADRIDPLKVSPPSIVDAKPEPQPRYVPYGFREPDPPFRWPKPLWKTPAK